MTPTKPKLFFLSLPAIAGALLVAAFLGYAAFVSFPLIAGPTLSVNAVKKSGFYEISGTAKRVSTLSIAGMETPLAPSGAFLVERAYPPGYTVVVVRAEDRFGRVREHTLTLLTPSP